MRCKKINYGYSLTLKRGIDFSTPRELFNIAKRYKIEYIITMDDFLFDTITLFFNPDKIPIKKERTLGVIIHD